MLSELLDKTDFYNKLYGIDAVCPVPKASDREAWDCLDASLKEKYIKKAEEYLNYDYPSLLATRYMEYIKNGNRANYEEGYFDRREAVESLIIGECIEYKGRFTDDIINGILLICEETSWVVPAHNNDIILGFSDDIHIDIFSSETGSLMSFAYLLLEDELNAISPLITNRIKTEVENRILKPYMANDFPWMSFGSTTPFVWNAWCNANCLAAFLIIEDDKSTRQKAVNKIARSLDKLINSYKEDGGCPEGVSYWEQTGGSLFEAFELLACADEEVTVIWESEKINNILGFPYKAHIDRNLYFNFADSSTKTDFNVSLLYRIGSRIQNDTITAFSRYLYNINKTFRYEKVYLEGKNLYRQIMDIFAENSMLAENIDTDFRNLRDVYFQGTEIMAARENSGGSGLYLAAKGGYNNKYHNHDDVGNFIVYKEGKPLLIDVGVEAYTSKTFSGGRYELWTMQSRYHNLPAFSGIAQKHGSIYKSNNVIYDCTDSKVTFSLDIEDAYGDFNVKKVRRMFDFYRNGSAYIEITDEYELLCHDNDTCYYFMCSSEPSLTEQENIEICYDGSKINLYYNSQQFSFAYEEIEISDSDTRLFPSWGSKIYRIILTLQNKNLKGKVYFKII